MPGGGTKLDTIPNKPVADGRTICLDLTRLVRRTGQVHTGVDRVEWAYLEWCLDLEQPVFALVRSAFGYLLLDRSGMDYARSHLRGATWPKPDLLSRFALKLGPARRGAETALRKQAVARSTPARLARMLGRVLPDDTLYLNTGHSNLTRRVLGAVRSHKGMQSAVLIHDMIPLDWPQYQRAGTVPEFEKRMRVVSELADVLICNSRQTLKDAERHLGDFGRMPPAFVAHLGVDMAGVEPVDPPAVVKPYVLVLGTIEPRKNHAILLDLWEDWPEAPHLVICGNRGWNNDAVFARLDAAKSRNPRISEFNGLGDGQIAALMRESAACLFPSFAEGYGLPPIEAASLGIPVICGDLEVYREVLGDFAVYADPSKAYEWRTAIEKVLRLDSMDHGNESGNPVRFTPPLWQEHFNQVLKYFG